MNTTDLIIIIGLALLIGSAGLYLYKQKKKGVKCVGCPHSQACASNSKCKDHSTTE